MRLEPSQSLCVITSLPARYRDPLTGLPYHSAYAYRCIQRLVSGACRWSNLLGCYVGPVYESPVGRPAAGVPERFLTGAAGATAQVGDGGDVAKTEPTA